MDNVLRCSIIFMILQIICISSGIASINAIRNTNFNKVIKQQNPLDSIYSSEPDDSDLPWLKEQNPLHNYDFDDYNHGEEELENSIEYSDENTQSAGSDYDEDEYEENESLISADKRSRLVLQGKRTSKHVDLCPIHPKRYKIRVDWKERGYHLVMNNTIERVCNHTTTTPGYQREYNRICYSLGRTFEYGHGTHCFQRYISKEIEVKSASEKKRDKYTEENFRDGCTCGWATYELGPIEDYHYNKILNLCSELKED